MSTLQIVYLVFGVVIAVALFLDLSSFSKKGQVVTIKQALFQTFFWIGLALSFFVFLLFEGQNLSDELIVNGQHPGKYQLAFEFLSAYLMEWSLSIDNIFVFILIFNAFKVKPEHYSRTLLVGIILAIVFRVIFITIGVALVERFHFVLYIFGVFLIYTGYKMFTAKEDDEFNPRESMPYRMMQRMLPLVPHDGGGKYTVRENGKLFYTTLFVVVIMLGAIDIVFALDSIPAVMGISQNSMVIYTSNIFAVLGLRALYFLLRGAVSKFDYLQQGIAVVLVFIGLKMLGEHWINQWIPDKGIQVGISLGVIVLCISSAMAYSIFIDKKRTREIEAETLKREPDSIGDV